VSRSFALVIPALRGDFVNFRPPSAEGKKRRYQDIIMKK